MNEGSLFSTSWPKFVVFHNSNSDRCWVISPCGFDLHFPDDQWCWASFRVPVDHLYVFFEKISIQAPCPLFKSVLFVLILPVCLCLFLCIRYISYMSQAWRGGLIWKMSCWIQRCSSHSSPELVSPESSWGWGGSCCGLPVTAAGTLVVEADPSDGSTLEGHPGACGLGRTGHQRNDQAGHTGWASMMESDRNRAHWRWVSRRKESEEKKKGPSHVSILKEFSGGPSLPGSLFKISQRISCSWGPGAFQAAASALELRRRESVWEPFKSQPCSALSRSRMEPCCFLNSEEWAGVVHSSGRVAPAEDPHVGLGLLVPWGWGPPWWW